MKKTLTCLAALATAFVASEGFAKDAYVKGMMAPVVKMSGDVKAFAMGKSMKHSAKSADRAAGKITGGSKGKLRLTVSAESTVGTEYGAIAEMDFRRDRTASQDFWRAVYAYYSSMDHGTVQLGDTEGAMAQTIVDGRDLMGGTGGFAGDMWVVATPTTGVMWDYLPATNTKYATKVVYRSPIMNGFQIAMSFTPHAKLWGLHNQTFGKDFDTTINSTTANPSIGRVTEVAMSYGFTVGDAGVNFYLGGALGKPTVPNTSAYRLHTLKTWQAGMLIDWNAFQFAAGMINNQRSMMKKDELGNAGTAYNAAVSYTFGRHTVALGYMGTTRRVVDGRAKANVGSMTYECQLAPGWSVFGEANYFTTKNTGQYLAQANVTSPERGFLYTSNLKKNNSGGVFLLGTSIRF